MKYRKGSPIKTKFWRWIYYCFSTYSWPLTQIAHFLFQLFFFSFFFPKRSWVADDQTIPQGELFWSLLFLTVPSFFAFIPTFNYMYISVVILVIIFNLFKPRKLVSVIVDGHVVLFNVIRITLEVVTVVAALVSQNVSDHTLRWGYYIRQWNTWSKKSWKSVLRASYRQQELGNSYQLAFITTMTKLV